MWLWEECFEKLPRVGRRVPRTVPKGLTVVREGLSLPQLLFMNGSCCFFFIFLFFYLGKMYFVQNAHLLSSYTDA